jgi:hypothetical protein
MQLWRTTANMIQENPLIRWLLYGILLVSTCVKFALQYVYQMARRSIHNRVDNARDIIVRALPCGSVANGDNVFRNREASRQAGRFNAE